MPEIISRAEAKKKGLKFYYTGKPCKHGHVDSRDIKLRDCLRCRDTRNNKPKTPEQNRQAYIRYKEKNYEKLAKRRREQSRKLRLNPEFREKQRKYFIQWRLKNPDYAFELNKKYKESGKIQKYYSDNKEQILKRQKEYRKTSEKYKSYNKRYFKKHGAEFMARRRAKDPIFKLSQNIRRRLTIFLKSKEITKRNKTFEIIGCSPKQLMNYLEKKFKPGMTWKNHGRYGWHVDHIKPLSLAKNYNDILKLSHFTNLQPLWASENIKKKDKY